MEKTSLWNRVGDWFRATAQPGADAEVAADADVDLGATNEVMVPSSRPAAPRKEITTRDRVEDGFSQLVSLVESVRGHLEAQDDRAERIVSSLQRIAESLSPLPERSQAQLESLEEIKRHLEAEAARLKRLEESLSQLPGLADAQRETMVSVGHQLDGMREAGERHAEAMDTVGDVLSGLKETNGVTVDALREIRLESSSREDRLTDLLRDQNQRLRTYAWAAIAMAAVVSLACIMALVK